MDTASFLDLISGRKQGLLASGSRLGLRILSYGYSAAARIRNLLFDVGWKRSHEVSASIISVGNLTTGGTGKTPFVAYLANYFTERNIKVGLLSRGYGSLDGEENDEKRVLNRLCPGVPHRQNPNRVQIARESVAEDHTSVLILDDGFQHRRLARDFDIVLIDATNPWGYGHILPRGLLREPRTGLKRASLAVITRVDQISPDQLTQLRTEINRIAPDLKVIEVSYPADQFIGLDNELTPLVAHPNEKVVAFCGIGNPDSFYQMLTHAGFALAPETFRIFPDHHAYSKTDLNSLAEFAHQHHASSVLTTLKDLVKISPNDWTGPPLKAVSIRTQIHAGADELHQHLDRFIQPKPASDPDAHG
ncbi:tetraacyldisaccharide 4'-kinase [Thalassoroseus pseudoceratinae]|uniref:tetraacyldisaccharide 4'-kinase n=1 Tax=Thalassoroseus pseudoceratinae TaxID=2713176 RepID=UPI001422CF3F|nr:tetraacyldisaccharide 4'-kinase [Thalassoroseus pseudoceratinae]